LGLGWLPVAPGTWGSLLPAAVFGLLVWGAAPAWATTAAMAILAVAGSAACVFCAPASMAARGKKDPGEVVMDEVAGQALTFLAEPLLLPPSLSGWESFLVALIGFVLFRAFDIAKPGPIRRLERLPAGWGILADDLAAGICSAVVLGVVVHFLVRA
jgi:phosphatidylglycerophosphatase A